MDIICCRPRSLPSPSASAAEYPRLDLPTLLPVVYDKVEKRKSILYLLIS